MCAFANAYNEGKPAGGDHPATIDTSTTDGFEAIRERIADTVAGTSDAEHEGYVNATTWTYCYHKEGSGRIFTDTTANKPAHGAAYSGSGIVARDGHVYLDTDTDVISVDIAGTWTDIEYVDLSTAQTIAGDKTFSGSSVFSGTVDIDDVLTCSSTVTLEDDVTVTAGKTFDAVDVGAHTHTAAAGHGPQIVVDSVADATWSDAKLTNAPSHVVAFKYTGDGAANRVIDLSSPNGAKGEAVTGTVPASTPKYVRIIPWTGHYMTQRLVDMPTNYCLYATNTRIVAAGYIQDFGTSTVTIGSNAAVNTNAAQYYGYAIF